MSVDKALLRAMTESVYALQSVRIVTGNRIVQAWYRTHGVEPGAKPDVELDAGDKSLLERIRRDYKRLTDGLVMLPRRAKFEPTDYISNYAELNLVRTYEHTLRAEDVAVKALEGEVQEHPMWRGYLAAIRGCGPLMAAALLCYLDPHKAERVSQFWSYAGLAVASDGTAQSRKAAHLIEREYVDKAGEVKTKKSVTFNPWMQTKMHVLGTCLLKANSPYKLYYDGYKKRLENMPPLGEQVVTEARPLVSTRDWSTASKAHRHNAAMRYMVKSFLADFWRAWRIHEGLPVTEWYGQAKLGLPPHSRDAA